MKPFVAVLTAFCAGFPVFAGTVYPLNVPMPREVTAKEISEIEALGAGDTIKKTGSGKLTYTAPFKFAGTLQIDTGTFALKNPSVVTNRMTLTGSGTFRIEAGEIITEATHNLTPDSSSFTGDYVIAGGTNTLMVRNGTVYAKFGALDSGSIVVNGGTFRLCSPLRDDGSIGTTSDYSGTSFERKRIRIRGTGADGEGAMLVDYYHNGIVGRMELDDDATIGGWLGPRGFTGPYFNFRYDWSGTVPTTLDLKGHTLTAKNLGHLTFNQYCSVSDDGRIILLKGNFNTYDHVNLGTPDGAGVIEFRGSDTQVTDYRTGSYNRPIEIKTTGYLNIKPVYNFTNTYVNASITFLAGNTGVLNFLSQTTNDAAVLNGKITGPGTVCLYQAGATTGYGSLIVNSRGNTQTGGFKMPDGQYGQRLVLAYADAINNYSKIYAKNGQLVVNGANWTSAKIISLAQQANIPTSTKYAQGAVFVDTSECSDETASLTVTTTDLSKKKAPLGHVGPGTLAISVDCSTISLPLRMGGGTIKLTGKNLVLADQTWNQTLETNSYLKTVDRTYESKVVIDGAKNVLLPGGTNAASILVLGRNKDEVPATDKPILVEIRNSYVHDDGKPTQSNGYSPLHVGSSAPAVIEFGEGTKFEGRMVLGYSQANGAVYQRAGDVFWRDGNTWNSRAWLGYGESGSCGYYELSGGTLTNNYIMTLGGGSRYTCGIVCQKGGTFKSLASDGTVNLANTRALGLWNQQGGSAQFRALCFGRADSGNADSEQVYLQEGGEASAARVVLCNGSTNNLANLALCGGRFSSDIQFSKEAVAVYASDGTGYKKGDAWRRPEWNKAYLSFNGGTWATKLKNNLFYTNDLRGVDRVTTYARGGAIEVGAGVTNVVNLPIQPPDRLKRGVASVPWTGAFSLKTFIGPPSVRIFGDGEGALAVARFDSTTRTVTGIDVVIPGTGYTWAKAELAYGLEWTSQKTSRYLVQTNDCVLTVGAPPDGGFTKKGEGVLEFPVTNTYTGDTVVAGGILLLGKEGVLGKSKPVLKGGIIQSKDGSAIPTVGFGFEVGATHAYTLPFAIPAGSTARVSGEPKKGVTRYVLATYTSFTGEPPVWENASDYLGWRLRFGETSCVLIKRRGMNAFVR